MSPDVKRGEGWPSRAAAISDVETSPIVYTIAAAGLPLDGRSRYSQLSHSLEKAHSAPYGSSARALPRARSLHRGMLVTQPTRVKRSRERDHVTPDSARQ